MIAFTADHVDGAEARYDVRQHLILNHPFDAGGREEARRTNSYAIRSAAAVAHEIKSELAVASFGVAVDFAGRQFHALHHDLEVSNRALDGRVNLRLGR